MLSGKSNIVIWPVSNVTISVRNTRLPKPPNEALASRNMSTQPAYCMPQLYRHTTTPLADLLMPRFSAASMRLPITLCHGHALLLSNPISDVALHRISRSSRAPQASSPCGMSPDLQTTFEFRPTLNIDTILLHELWLLMFLFPGHYTYLRASGP